MSECENILKLYQSNKLEEQADSSSKSKGFFLFCKENDSYTG